jgi:hypothetical protein
MRPLGHGVVVLLLSAGPVHAADVTFTGIVLNTCSLVATPGLLGLSSDGETLGSEETGGLAAEVAIVSLGVNTVTVGAPTRTGSPVSYNAAGEVVSVAYQGLVALGGISQSYTTATTDFDVGILPLTVVEIDNRIVNSNGFAQGTYETTTVVTCS